MKIPKHRLTLYPLHWDKKFQVKWYSYYTRSIEKKKEFNLSDDLFEYLFTQSCVYCGDNKEITIDRISSDVGYITNNVQPVCNMCNRMKLTQTEEEFKNKLLKILKHCNWG